MKFTENAVEKAAADHCTVASPSSLNRALFGYPQHYRREHEHGVRFPGQLPPSFDGSYTSMFGNYRPHPTSEPAPRPAHQLTGVISPDLQYCSFLTMPPLLPPLPMEVVRGLDLSSNIPTPLAIVPPEGPPPRVERPNPSSPPSPCYAPMNAVAGSAPTTTACAGPDDALSQGMNGMSFNTSPPDVEPRYAHVAGASYHRHPPPYAPSDALPRRIPHPQEMSMAGFDSLPLEPREAIKAVRAAS
ncbi:hypothetical protein THAOC_27167 [Thalassiosira oceanica]|uniref:Uncharacterized protein n=1 Tax=Thalassiosira oceanica TaxID=159749 RepID=K0RX18_THAOC|nr:hypothetical protein THAOC_27167 [Thalassiosira oceanica]|eukprot:EJK53406.1 hypothetical protein THAOC_27167 [Thalassiosira oceanica]